jgi:hypothetical protein
MTLSDIKTKIYDLTKTNSTSYPAASMLIDLNSAFSRITSLIIQSDGRWQWDDSNQAATDQGGGLGGQQNGTTSLVSGQQDYSFPVSYLKIFRIEIKGNGATAFTKLLPRDARDPKDDTKTQAIDTVTTGTPTEYDLTGQSVFLYPIPDYSQAASLRFYFQRGQVDFTSSDLSTGTLVPGFASLFHDLLAYLVARDYVLTNQPNLYQGYANTVQQKEMELKKYYAWRNPDDRNRLTMAEPMNFI